MPAAEPGAPVFADTNVLLYLLSADALKADRAEALLESGCTISVQVLNEFVNVARRKLQMTWEQIDDVLGVIRALCRVEPVTLQAHDMGRFLAERYGLSFYDALIVAAALQSECATLYSEDMQHGLRVERKLRVCNPFVK